MKILIILFLLLIPTTAYASSYAFEEGDGVRIITLSQGSDLNTEMKKIGREGVSTVEVTEYPDKKDRDFWVLKNGKIKVDQDKKQAYKDKIALKKQKKEANLQKLNLTDDEWKELNDKDVQDSVA